MKESMSTKELHQFEIDFNDMVKTLQNPINSKKMFNLWNKFIYCMYFFLFVNKFFKKSFNNNNNN